MPGDEYYVYGAVVGGLVLLVLVLFCVTCALLCKILRRLRELLRLIQPPPAAKSPSKENGPEAVAADPEKADEPESSPTDETNAVTAEETEPLPPEKIEAMYARISQEHREKKKKTKLCIQQYDDINLLELDRKETEEKNEGPQMVVSITMEEDETGYSRLQHAGPRMSQTRKHIPSTSSNEPQQQDGGKKSSAGIVSAANMTNSSKDVSYSEVYPTHNLGPATKLTATNIVGGYSVIERENAETEVPPPLPHRLSLCVQSPGDSTQKPSSSSHAPSLDEVQGQAALKRYQNMPHTAALGGTKEGGVVEKEGAPNVTDNKFIVEGFSTEFHDIQAQGEAGTGEILYEIVT